MKKWGRDDVLQWVKNYKKAVLAECGCENEDFSVYQDDMYKTPHFTPEILQSNIPSQPDAMCPDTYQNVADHVCQDPYAALESIKPIMQQIGVGCPQSFAQALADIFGVAQDMGIKKSFNTEKTW